MADDNLREKLLYLENRVALAKILFPTEAIVAMETAHADGTLEFKLDLNEAPFVMKEGHLARMKALSKTVELGKRLFPRCSKVLEDIMDDENEFASLGRDTSIEKIRRLHDLQDALRKAFSEDREEFD